MQVDKDGGLAFPGSRIEPNPLWSEGEKLIPRMVEVTYPGLSVRDYFAAKAMASILTHAPTIGTAQAERHDVANLAYEFADAILKARAK